MSFREDEIFLSPLGRSLTSILLRNGFEPPGLGTCTQEVKES